MSQSQINPAYPVYGNPTTQSVRSNFEKARDEINDLENDLRQLETEAVKKAPNGDVTVQKLIAHALHLGNLPVHIDNNAAHQAGMQIGDVYRDLLGFLKVVH